MEKPNDEDSGGLARCHLRFGWWALLAYLTLGAALEVMHGFKVGWYLDVMNETRRLMWTLAHAHGTLLALINIAFSLTVQTGALTPRQFAIADPCLLAAGVLLPAGFFLGGFFNYGSDPGLGILLVPVGAVLLFVGVLLTARGAPAPITDPKPEPADGKPRRQSGNR